MYPGILASARDARHASASDRVAKWPLSSLYTTTSSIRVSSTWTGRSWTAWISRILLRTLGYKVNTPTWTEYPAAGGASNVSGVFLVVGDNG